MNRREALKAASLLLGGAMVRRPALLTRDAAAIAQAPATTVRRTPLALMLTTGADRGDRRHHPPRHAVVARCEGGRRRRRDQLLLTDCYDRAAAAARCRTRGLRTSCATQQGRDFADTAARHARETLLREHRRRGRARPATPTGSTSRASSRLRAYFSSRDRHDKALRYVRVPGRWTGCVPLTPASRRGDKLTAWRVRQQRSAFDTGNGDESCPR